MNDFLVWHQGPDDIHACKTWLSAVALANNLNTNYHVWASNFTKGGGTVTVRSWAIPYTVEDYRAETGHEIDLSGDDDEPQG